MSDLISREDVLRLAESGKLLSGSFGERAKDIISSIPTAEPKVGRWIDDEEYNTEYGYYFANCSECGYQIDVHENRGYYKYCPNCGSYNARKMERSE